MTTTDNREATVVRPKGRITALNAEDFRKELLQQVESGHRHLIVDLSEVDLIDSKGLAVFIMCHQALAVDNGSLTVITAHEDIQQLFRVMRLDRHFTVRSA